MRTLNSRLFLVFAALLLACSGVSIWLQMRAGERQEQATAQHLSAGLAAHIAQNAELMDANGLRPDAVRMLFDRLMAVNPAVEVYLLAPDGRIAASAAPPDRRLAERVDLTPVRQLLAGAPLPIFGTDPRHPDQRKVFDAAPLRNDGRDAGYVYVVLQSEARDAAAAKPFALAATLRTTALASAVVALLGIVMGLILFRQITRPLRQLTQEVSRVHVAPITTQEPPGSGQTAAAPAARTARIEEKTTALPRTDEITALRQTFEQMRDRIASQVSELALQDRRRRELIANISHDLRTPLTSLHGYLETLRQRDTTLDNASRARYLDLALNQSDKVGKLAETLFDLARLESGLVEPERETFSLRDLLQDVLQKFELAARNHGQDLTVELPPSLPSVHADIGMIERVLTNLLDNAIRHNPPGTRVSVRLHERKDAVRVEVTDTGPGIPTRLRAGLFERPSALRRGSESGRLESRQPGPGSSGGLGLIIVRRLLQLHGSDIELVDGVGATFQFDLEAA